MTFSPLFREIVLLTEANVFNGKDIEKYLQDYAKNLRTPAGKQVFVKKLSRFLMNDENNLYALRELPPDAPEWAQMAMQKGELMKFVPDEELNDKVQHISHFIAALEDDSNSTNADTKAVASREFQGLANVGSMEILVQKSHEYFKRGSRAAGKEIDGSEHMLTTSGGFNWYKLITPAAYQREGKVLQNCIGRVYLPGKDDTTKIYVLKDAQGNSAAAMRVTPEGMQEVKGKQNKPPVAKYMPAVQEFINKLNVKVARSGMYDIEATGYIWHDDKLYTKAQAIEKFVESKKVGNLPEGDVVEVSSPIESLMKSIYGAGRGYYGDDRTFKVYELRRGNKPVAFAKVTEGGRGGRAELEKVGTLASLNDQVDEAADFSSEQSVMALTNFVLKRHKNITVDKSVANSLYAGYNLVYREKERQVEPLVADEVEDTEDKFTRKSYKKGAKDIAKRLYDISTGPYGRNDSILPTAEKDPPVGVYHMRRKADTDDEDGADEDAWLVHRKSGATAMFQRKPATQYDAGGLTGVNVGLAADNRREINKVKHIVNLANEKNLKLPPLFKINHGLISTDKGKLSRVSLTPTTTDKTFNKWDFSSLPEFDRLAALHAVSNDLDDKTLAATDAFNISQVVSSYNRADDVYATSHRYVARQRVDSHITDEEIVNRVKKAIGDIPDSLITVRIGYGAKKQHLAKMLLAGNRVVAIDGASLRQTWQGWDDFKKVADQLNDFAKTHNLKFSKEAISAVRTLAKQGDNDQPIPHEFSTTPGGTLLTKQQHLQNKLEKKGVGTETVTYADGGTITKMTAPELAEWSRVKLQRNLTGKDEGWIIRNPAGQITAKFVTKGDKFKHYTHEEGQDTRGTVDEHARLYSFLKSKNVTNITDWRLADYRDMYSIRSVLEKIRDRTRTNLLTSDATRVVNINVLRALVKAGLIEPTGPADEQRLKLTERGRTFLDNREYSRTTSLIDLLPAAKIQSHDVQAAVPKERPKTKYSVSTATPKSGTKAELALQKFTDMTNDNGGTQPTRGEFIRVLTQPPFDMSAAGAQTYFYTTKAKYLAAQGAVNESTTFIDFLMLLQ